MPMFFWQSFYRGRMPLSSGGVFDFDAVIADKTIVASISTGGSRTARGKYFVGKMNKLRSDMLYLLSEAPRRVMVLCEEDMYTRCQLEESERVPKEIEFVHAALPDELATRLVAARKLGSDEVSPLK